MEALTLACSGALSERLRVPVASRVRLPGAPTATIRLRVQLRRGCVSIPCLDVEVTLEEIYARVELPAVGEPEPAGYEVGEYDSAMDE